MRSQFIELCLLLLQWLAGGYEVPPFERCLDYYAYKLYVQEGQAKSNYCWDVFVFCSMQTSQRLKTAKLKPVVHPIKTLCRSTLMCHKHPEKKSKDFLNLFIYFYIWNFKLHPKTHHKYHTLVNILFLHLKEILGKACLPVYADVPMILTSQPHPYILAPIPV